MGLKRVRKEVRVGLVPSLIVASLVLIGLIALVAKGPPIVYVYSGPSPLNNGALGTSQLLVLLRSRYPSTYPVLSPNDIEKLIEFSKPSHCVYVLISPGIPVSLENARSIVSAMMTCPHPSFLVADESTFSNTLLKVLKVRARIAGTIVIDSRTKLPYPTAIFKIGTETAELRLDIASSISSCINVVGWVKNAIVLKYLETSKGYVYIGRGRACIAEKEQVGKFLVFVIGDGSIFLNQVLESSKSREYANFIRSLFDYLCQNDSKCLILVDAMHYMKTNPIEALKNPKLFEVIDPLTLIPALIAYAIHPAVWMPPLLRISNRVISSALANPYLAPIVVASLTLISLAIVRKQIGSERDYRLSEQYEVGALIERRISELLARGVKTFNKDDFRNLYSMVNEAMEMFIGVNLSSPQCVEVLSKYVDRRKAENFVKRMNAYLRKARGESLLPIVLSWSRVVKRMIRESEEILNALGTSLDRGVEVQ